MTNLAQLLQRHSGTPDKVLYRQWHDSGESGSGDASAGWRDYTVAAVTSLARRWQQAFRDRGFEKGDRVAICLKNSVQWVAIDQAALGMGLVVVPLYVIDNAENIAWCVGNSDARLLVLDTPRTLARLRELMPVMPTVVCIEGARDDSVASVETVDAFLATDAEGSGSTDFEVQSLDPDTLATVVYTSGTTGKPKGVKLSHANILANVEASAQVIELRDTDTALSVLPMSHMFERTCGYYLMLHAGACVAFARGIQQIGDDLAAVRPTLLIAVPRLFERFLARIEQAVAGSSVKRTLLRITVRYGWKAFLGEANLLERLAYARLQPLVGVPILAKLGGRLRLAGAGGAKLELRIARTFIGLGLPMIQGYGLTEASPVIAANRETDNDPSSVGQPLAGLEYRVSEANVLMVRGPSVMQGYWRNPEATAKVLSADGWLDTGDIVEIRDGKIYIRGRSKDLIVLSNGEKFPPEEAEVALLDNPVFEQVMLVGEGRHFLTLVTVSQDTDEKKLVRLANQQLKDFPRYVRVRRVIPVQEPWTIDNGMLTPTLKVKRPMVMQRFAHSIDAVYGAEVD
ncbi:MAG: AMP-binding protein [Proteobacteria bacterium]|nr:AMP-binding protein [Burkholderiales bacterium]